MTRSGISPKKRFTVLERDRFTCRYCGRRPPEVVLHIDHVRSRKNGGGNSLENLAASCDDCNLGKGSGFPRVTLLDVPKDRNLSACDVGGLVDIDNAETHVAICWHLEVTGGWVDGHGPSHYATIGFLVNLRKDQVFRAMQVAVAFARSPRVRCAFDRHGPEHRVVRYFYRLCRRMVQWEARR